MAGNTCQEVFFHRARTTIMAAKCIRFHIDGRQAVVNADVEIGLAVSADRSIE
jgi:hypothetical protein